MLNVRCRYLMLAGLGCLPILTSACSDSQPSLDGYWNLVSTHDSAKDTTAPVVSGTAVIHFHNGLVELYLSDGTNKGCGTKTYTVQGNVITYDGAAPNTFELSNDTLRLTTMNDGAPIGYSDFVRLTSFDAKEYGVCTSTGSGG